MDGQTLHHFLALIECWSHKRLNAHLVTPDDLHYFSRLAAANRNSDRNEDRAVQHIEFNAHTREVLSHKVFDFNCLLWPPIGS